MACPGREGLQGGGTIISSASRPRVSPGFAFRHLSQLQVLGTGVQSRARFRGTVSQRNAYGPTARFLNEKPVPRLLLSRWRSPAAIILFLPLLLNQPPPQSFPLLFPPSPIKPHNHICERLRTYPFHMALAIQAKLSL